MNIHPTAIVSPKAALGRNVTIGPFCIIHDKVHIGDNTVVQSYCELGLENKFTDDAQLYIGKDSLIRSHSTLYVNSTFGDDFSTGHRVTIREKTFSGAGLQIGTLCDIQGYCSFGDHVKLQSNIVVAQKTEIGNFVWIFPYVIITNDPQPPSENVAGCKIGDFAVLASQSVILPGIEIGSDTLIGAGSVVTKNVERFSVIMGNPGRRICSIDDIKMKDKSGNAAYPWRRRFHRSYPATEIEKWIAEFSTTTKK